MKNIEKLKIITPLPIRVHPRLSACICGQKKSDRPAKTPESQDEQTDNQPP